MERPLLQKVLAAKSLRNQNDLVLAFTQKPVIALKPEIFKLSVVIFLYAILN